MPAKPGVMAKNPGRIDFEEFEKNIKLDVKDRKILTLLSENARTPLTQIAHEVALSRDAIDYRLKRLSATGVIQKFFALVDFAKLGYYAFHVFLTVDEDQKDLETGLHGYLADHPNVFSVIEYSDRWDYEIGILARNLLEFDRIMMDLSEKFSKLIIEKYKLEIIKKYNERYVPVLIKEKKQEIFKEQEHKEGKAAVDEKDLKLLRILAEDCRLSTYDIGKRIGMNADTVSYRMKHLVAEGIIRRFTIQVNFSAMKYHWYTFSIETKMFDRQNERKFLAFLEDNRHIMLSAKTLGGWDLLMYILVENPREFHRIVKDIKGTFSSITRNYQTFVAYKEHVFKTLPEAVN
jgi:DNA-binding Lrp family transcriptional regulator